MASTGSRARRELLRALALVPVAALAPARRAQASEYGSAAEVLDTIDRLEADVASHLRAVEGVLPAAAAFVAGVTTDLARHRRERDRLRRRLRLPASSPSSRGAADADLRALRGAQEALVFAHAEGLPALGDSFAVDVLARHMVVLAGHLTVVDLWIEAEEARG